MKLFILIFSIFLIILYVDTFEYREEYNTEDEGRSFDEYYKGIGEESFNYYEPVLTPMSAPTDNNGVPNDVLIAANEKKSDEINTEPKDVNEEEPKKTYYNEKDAPELFQKFIKDFNKQYKDEEEYNKRYQNFVKNLKDINQLNKEQDTIFEINMFADLGEGESVIG